MVYLVSTAMEEIRCTENILRYVGDASLDIARGGGMNRSINQAPGGLPEANTTLHFPVCLRSTANDRK